METLKVDDNKRWQGSYNGTNWQVACWKHKGMDSYVWNYYIYVKPRRLKTTQYKDHPKRVDYYKMYQDVEMHGGITWWSRHKSSRLHEVDELGCDYSHGWDEGREYDLKDILRDVKNTIDTLPDDLKFKTT